jgi:hypothetical protein
VKKTPALAPDTATGSTKAVTDKKGYGQRWLFSPRHVDNLIAGGLPHLKIGSRRVRIVIEEADKWMLEKYGTQRRGKLNGATAMNVRTHGDGQGPS